MTSRQWIGIALVAAGGLAYYRHSRRQKVVDKARSYEGVTYRLGGSNYETSDCSGMTRNAYRAVGIELPRVARQQRQTGQAVDVSALAPADLVYVRSTGAHDHVGIFGGEDDVIHCSSSKGKCYVDSLARWKRVKILHGARRFL
ncbi:MAG: C40 family peptidase [Deltaproteobacteria bacterium]|nr:C40 family peptidase [Deltaproteobacteria bacterium]